jgi:ubiquinone biosynthesis protein UbiJ
MRPVEFAVERALARVWERARSESPRACEILATLKGRRLAIAISGTPWAQRPLVLEFTSGAPRLRIGTAGSNAGDANGDAPGADATLRGAPLSLLALTGPDPQAVIRRGDVQVQGDAQLVQRVRELLPLLAPDLEQELAHVVGRSAAHVLAGAVRAGAAGVRRSAWSAVQNAAEYLAHESGELVSRREAEHFLRGVEQAREQLDRLDARLERLARLAGAPAEDPGGGPGPD